MTELATALNAETTKLVELIDVLKNADLDYDEAIDRAAKYLGNDDRIEQARDERAQSAYLQRENAKQSVVSQLKVIEALIEA